MAGNPQVGMKCIKYMLFISNFKFAVIGFLLISIGSRITSIYGDYGRFMESHYFSPAAFIVAIGVIIFCVAIFGCVAAIRESTMLVNLYSGLLAILLILEISTAIPAYAMRFNIVEVIETNMISSMKEYGQNASTTNSWDLVQQRLTCCGVNKIQDWSFQKINGIEVTIRDETFEIPKSCCSHPNCHAVYERGCLDCLSYIISESAFMLGSVAVCVASVQIFGIGFSYTLVKAIRRIKTNEEMNRQQNRQRIYDQLALGPVEKLRPILYTPLSSAA